MEETEGFEVVMGLIMHSGNAKSLGMEAVQAAKNGDFKAAGQKLEEANEEIVQAHHAQTGLLTQEASGETFKVTLLMIHAQDHLMNTITFLDLAKELIDVHKILNQSE
ncbi:PTS mannose transporter subunit IIA [Sporosarcina globispora]|uniref:PTS mannose transporter subunit IIA n=1 Tax=Sporosarcina globispora TaxID=1459 RepID=A0A0M0GES4_SPOGL|nr:PTS lactose/cellobiose transporter subunit IIA [Sporosarcina globispora]KON87936.1 PTS mannose transporter subunit IIA [Sporosarcina globispora]